MNPVPMTAAPMSANLLIQLLTGVADRRRWTLGCLDVLEGDRMVSSRFRGGQAWIRRAVDAGAGSAGSRRLTMRNPGPPSIATALRQGDDRCPRSRVGRPSGARPMPTLVSIVQI